MSGACADTWGIGTRAEMSRLIFCLGPITFSNSPPPTPHVRVRKYHLIAHWLRVSYLSLNSLTSLLVSFLSNESEPSAYVPNKLRILGTVTGGLAHLRVCRGAVTCLVIATPHSQRDIYLVLQNGCY